MDTYSYISENGVIREIADLAARTKNAEQDLSINEVTLKTNRLAGYSESEAQIGTWLDGKQVYRKAFPVRSGVTLWEEHWLDTTFGLPAAEINLWERIVGGKYVGRNKSFYPMNFRWQDSHVYATVLNSGKQTYSEGSDYIVVEYTKV